MRLIDADALKEVIFSKTDSMEDLWDTAGVLNAINNAPTVPQVTVCCENASKEEIAEFKQELENVLKRPQGEQIAWEQGYECGKNESRPKGEWKLHGMIYYCSECGHECGESGDNFCGNCGADMRGEKNE